MIESFENTDPTELKQILDEINEQNTVEFHGQRMHSILYVTTKC